MDNIISTTFTEENTRAIAVAYAGYTGVRIADLDSVEDVKHGILMIDFLRVIQERVGLEMVPSVDLEKKLARMERLLAVVQDHQDREV